MTTNQAVVHFTYPAAAAADFDMDYYVNKHVPLLQSRWKDQGLRQYIVSVGEEGKDNYHAQATLFWESVEAFNKADFKEELADDVRNFTSSKPTLTVAKVTFSGSVST